MQSFKPARTRWQHLRQVLLRPMWILFALAWSIFSCATDIRDNFLSAEIQSAWATRVVLGWLPKLDWHVWIMGMLFICVVAMFEMSFRQRRTDTALLEKWIGNGAFHRDYLRLYNRGRRLSDDCDEFPQKPLPEAETKAWVKDTETFLMTRTPEPLNELYIGMFHEDAKLSKPGGPWTRQSELRYEIDCQVYQLHQIMNSLTMMRLSGVANQFGPDVLSASN
jgi:hypothetical protein